MTSRKDAMCEPARRALEGIPDRVRTPAHDRATEDVAQEVWRETHAPGERWWEAL